ncbi:MAG: ATP-dependent Clp protease ATP-binding subunit, partial [Elusimicrobia bacterium]|nr:ATP-dependent Clp protease ATP-binding subunit [Elusimicrobiota bacterium]
DAAPAPAAELEARALAREDGDWRAKIGADAELGEREARLTFAAGLPEAERARLLAEIEGMSPVLRSSGVREDGSVALTMRWDESDVAEAAEAIAQYKGVASLSLPPSVRDRLLAVSLPGKIASHGKEHWSVGAVMVRFAPEATREQIEKTLAARGEERLYRYGDFYVLHAAGAEKAAEAARALAGDADVAAVEVHPNVAARLENRAIMPYPEAADYDPSQAVLVQFKDGATEGMMKEYAQARRLRLVYPQYRGKAGLALLEVPAGADAAATRQMLADETLDEGSTAAEIKPFKEQPGEEPLQPSPAARERAAARKAAEEAQALAAAHKPRRDAAAEWLSFLQNRKLADGTTLTDKQVQLLAEFLKPVAKGPDEPRPPVVARTEEVKRILPIVTSPRGMRNSVILVGGAGTGKTAVAEGLAEMIEDADHASANDADAFLQFRRLKGRWLVELDINKILSSDDPVKILNAVLDLLPRFNDPNPGRGNEVLVLMDEIQKFFLDPSGQKIANVLKGPLRDGRISVIATTTDAEYKKFIESDDAFRRRLEKIEIEEPTVPQTTRILRAMKAWLQKIHDAIIPDEALVAAAKLTDQFDKTNFNPDKAIKAVQDGAELSRPDNLRAAITLDIRETWGELVVAVNEARQTLLDKGLPSTLALPVEAYNRVAELIAKADALYSEREAIPEGKGRLTTDVVKRVIAQKTGIASGQLNLAEDDAARYVKMERTVGERVVNQESAIRAIADAIRRNKAGLSNPNRPMGKFLLVGPTGVGKTYLAKELARFLFNDPEAMVRFDMSEFMEEHSAMRLTGAPPSYVGYGEGGQLTEAVRKKPYSVILFDEVEKAHPKVFDLLLQILDDGRLTDGEGRTVDFKNTVILMTSNAGMAAVDGETFARRLKAARDAGDVTKAIEVEREWDADIDQQVAEAIHGRFRPEFLNRLDDGPTPLGADGKPSKDETKKVKWIRVNRLRQQDMEKIARLQVREFQDLLADRHDTDLVVDDSVIRFLSEEGYSPLYGARPMTGAIEKNIVDPLAQWILSETAAGRKEVRGGLIRVTMKDGRVEFSAEKKPESAVERASIKDAAASVAAEVFTLIERLAAGEEAEEPSEALFDKALRAARPSAPKADAAASAAAGAPAFYAPGTALAMPAGARVARAEHNRPRGADPAARAAIRDVVASAQAAGWPQDVLDALSVPAGRPGEGWLKQAVAYQKERAEKAGAGTPVELVDSVGASSLKVLVHSPAELSEADQAYLAAHFSGTPPESYEAAQRAADGLAPTSAIVRNHNLLDLHRRLAAIPGARVGWASGASARGGQGSDLWLEIRKTAPPASAAEAETPAEATPHQRGEMGKVMALLARFIDQSRLAPGDQDGHSIRIAAAESYARLAGPADADAARALIREKGWNADGATVGLSHEWALAMTQALVLQRFAQPEDAELLEGVLLKAGSLSGDAYAPVRAAFVEALSRVYRAGGLAFARESAIRVAQIGHGNALIQESLHRALGFLGYPADEADAKSDGEGLADLYRRMGKSSVLLAEFGDDAAWNKAGGPRQTAILKTLAADGEPSEKNFTLLRKILQGKRGASDRGVRYAAAETWATLAARAGLTQGVSAGIKKYLDERGVAQDDETWAVMLAYVLALEKAGRPEDLPELERLMSVPPGYSQLHYRHEQAYFAAPEAWARIVVRSGLFASYARPTLGPDGAPEPSRLQRMLTDKEHPVMGAAALRAMALARDPSFKEKPAEPSGDAPVLHPGPKGVWGGGGAAASAERVYPHGRRDDYLTRRFGWERLPPMP